MFNGIFCTNITQSLKELLAVHGNCPSWPYSSKLALPTPHHKDSNQLKKKKMPWLLQLYLSVACWPCQADYNTMNMLGAQ